MITEIKKVWAVFVLNEAVSGVSDSLTEYHQQQFTMAYPWVFDTEAECERFIYETMVDFQKQDVAHNARFVILSVFCYQNDKIFKYRNDR